MKTVVTASGSLLDTLQLLVPGASKRTLRQMLVQNRISVNGEVCRIASHGIQSGDTVTVGPRRNSPNLPTGLEILYEDDALLVICKPSGLLSVATPDEREQTVHAYLRQYLEAINPRQKIYVVHRLDKFASGILVFAKSEAVQYELKVLFSRHDIRRIYWAIVEGEMAHDRGTIRSYLTENQSFHVYSTKNREEGKLAVTHYRVLRRLPGITVLEVTLETGRKNQIRAHLSEIGHPITGDRAYGSTIDPVGRLALHAYHLGFMHPTRNTPMEFTNEPPPKFLSFLPKTKPSR